MNKKYIVKEKSILTDFLVNFISKKDVKRLLSNKKIIVNNKVVVKYDYQLNKNDEVIINLSKTELNIVYEDKHLLVVDKPYNLLSVATEGNKKTLYNQVSDYVKIKGKNNKVFIVNRLDKDTSGLVLFAKNQDIKLKLQDDWDNVIRKYIAIVVGKTKQKDVIKSYLVEDGNLFVKSAKTGKLAITEYEKLKENSKYTWLDINIKTGRKNQIRVHLKDIGCEIVGDTKYGGIKDKRMYLHGYKVVFNHPVTNKSLEINSIIPSEFKYRF